MLLSDRINGRLVSPDIRRTKANSPAKGTSYETSRKVGGRTGIGFLVYLGIGVRGHVEPPRQRYSWNFLVGGENVCYDERMVCRLDFANIQHYLTA